MTEIAIGTLQYIIVVTFLMLAFLRRSVEGGVTYATFYHKRHGCWPSETRVWLATIVTVVIAPVIVAGAAVTLIGRRLK